MCSYGNISDVKHDSASVMNENWEKDLWANVLSPNSNVSNTLNTAYEFSNTSTNQAVHGKNDIATPSLQGFKVQFSTDNHNVETSTLLSPTWEDSTYEITQKSDMSTYFSTFNPASQDSQLEKNPMHQNPMMKTTSLKTPNATGYRKIHRARVSLVPSGNGTFKAVVKRKRKRTVFTTEQLEVLEAIFLKKPYVTRDERAMLVENLQVNDKSIKVWFQNRRLKNKRGEAEDYEVTQPDKCTLFDRLNNVESGIIERTNKFGYVTLDDTIMSDLVSIIDDYFLNKISQVSTNTEIASPIYEPISPAGVSDYSCEDNNASGQHYDKPNEYLENLVDIESLISV